MKRSPTLLTGIIAIVLLFLSNSRVLAGVVISETMVSSDPIGGSKVQTRRVYTQGDKRKVEERGIDVITDLDRDILYVVDKNQREYAEIPLRALALPRSGDGGSALETIHFHGTKKMRVIANLPCREYRGVIVDQLKQVMVKACVSDDIAGAGEVAAFERKIMSRLEGTGAGHSSRADPDRLVLEKDSAGSVRIPDVSGKESYRTMSVSAITKVDSIQVQPLAAVTFVPPKDFSKVDGQAGAKSQEPLRSAGEGIGVVFLPPLPESEALSS
jgi:hypothetical protein